MTCIHADHPARQPSSKGRHTEPGAHAAERTHGQCARGSDREGPGDGRSLSIDLHTGLGWKVSEPGGGKWAEREEVRDRRDVLPNVPYSVLTPHPHPPPPKGALPWHTPRLRQESRRGVCISRTVSNMFLRKAVTTAGRAGLLARSIRTTTPALAEVGAVPQTLAA